METVSCIGLVYIRLLYLGFVCKLLHGSRLSDIFQLQITSQI